MQAARGGTSPNSVRVFRTHESDYADVRGAASEAVCIVSMSDCFLRHTDTHMHGIQRIRNAGWTLLFSATLLSAPVVAGATNSPPRIRLPATARPEEIIPGIRADHAVMPASLSAALTAALHRRVPSFSRQTGLACSACHYQFLQLTPFGRLFKLNG